MFSSISKKWHSRSCATEKRTAPFVATQTRFPSYLKMLSGTSVFAESKKRIIR